MLCHTHTHMLSQSHPYICYEQTYSLESTLRCCMPFLDRHSWFCSA
jgi:hypothetical protein